MTHRSARVLALLALAACGEAPMSPRAASGAANLNEGAAPTAYIVSFNGDRIPSSFASRIEALGGTITAAYDGAGLAVVDGISEAGAASLTDLGEVGRDEVFQVLDPTEVDAAAAEATAVDFGLEDIASPTNPAGAFFYPRQWNLRLVGANVAWAAGHRGSGEVKVAILDTGIDGRHPDLNGLVDTANSKSFVPSDDVIAQAMFPTRHVTTDLHYHGTHVAATVSSNAVAAAGVTSMTKLMAVKVLSRTGSGASSGILAGIMYAADRGADIISMSLGNLGTPFDMHNKANKEYFNKVAERAFKYAHSKGSIVVVAAGNQAQNLDVPQTYKPYCGSKHVICVSAVGPSATAGTNGPWTNPDTFAPYSNYGYNKIDIAAPGGFAAPVTAACSGTSLNVPICRTGTFVTGLNGTSMATPHVSGLLALVIADKKVGRGALRSHMYNTAVDLGATGKDAYFGNGRIDIARALGLQ